jgi:hypothetical protein
VVLMVPILGDGGCSAGEGHFVERLGKQGVKFFRKIFGLV